MNSHIDVWSNSNTLCYFWPRNHGGQADRSCVLAEGIEASAQQMSHACFAPYPEIECTRTAGTKSNTTQSKEDWGVHTPLLMFWSKIKFNMCKRGASSQGGTKRFNTSCIFTAASPVIPKKVFSQIEFYKSPRLSPIISVCRKHLSERLLNRCEAAAHGISVVSADGWDDNQTKG